MPIQSMAAMLALASDTIGRSKEPKLMAPGVRSGANTAKDRHNVKKKKRKAQRAARRLQRGK